MPPFLFLGLRLDSLFYAIYFNIPLFRTSRQHRIILTAQSTHQNYAVLPKTSETVDTEKEASGDSQLGAYQFHQLKTSLIRLKKSDPKAYNKICGPFFEAAGKLDLSMDQEKYTSMRNAKEAREAAAADAEKKSLAELEKQMLWME